MPAVCVLGGGYAGLRVARELPGRLDHSWSITLVDRGECHQLITRLPEVVATKIPARDACIPFKDLLNRRVQHLRADIQAVDLATRRVHTSAGPLQPDVLVIAVGTTPDFLNIPGAATHSATLKSVQDAVRIRDKIAELRSGQPLVRVVIMGAGYTGTEVAGELSAPDYARRTGTGLGAVEVCIVSEDARLLPQASSRLSAAVERILRTRHIPLYLGQSVRRVDATGLETEGRDVFPADLLVWAGQTHVSFQVLGSAGSDAAGGKLRVDPYLQVGNDGSIFACGDVASVFDYARGSIAASSAQLALQEGQTVARNIGARADGRALEEYRPRSLGEALGLGGKDAAAEVGGLIVSGRAAAAIKRAALVRYLTSLSVPSTV
jgi:NADH:ubiquinone reductase (H+-translocating)